MEVKIGVQNVAREIRRAGDNAKLNDGRQPISCHDLRHSFASLLLHEGRSVIYVARQLGHGAALTMSTYGHVIDELEDAPAQDAEDAIRAARCAQVAPGRTDDAIMPFIDRAASDGS